METVAQFNQKITLDPKEYNKLGGNVKLESLILNKAKEAFEGKCIQSGFIIPNTLKIISRSAGYFESGRYISYPSFYTKFEASVVYPVNNTRVIGKVVRKNKMGLYVTYKDALRIQVARDIHIGNEEFENVEIGDDVEVELKKSRFQVNDPFILSCASFITNKTVR